MDLLEKIPCWYIYIAIFFGIFQGVRGVIEHMHYDSPNITEKYKQIIILYIHAFWFRFVCTLAGFISLYASYFILSNSAGFLSLSTANATLLVSSFIVGVIGVGGQLHYVIVMGKLRS